MISPRVAWISVYDPLDSRGGWRGMNHYLFHALKRRFKGLEVLAPLTIRDDRLQKWESRLLTFLTGRRLMWAFSDRALSRYESEFYRRSVEIEVDLFLFFGSQPYLKIKPKKPFACYLDSGFLPFLEIYHANRNYTLSEIKRLESLENDWLSQCRMIFTSSNFARNALLDRYRLDKEKIKVVYAGPNITLPKINTGKFRDRQKRILFICSDFFRKGGELVLKAVQYALKYHPNLTVDVIGEKPPNNLQQDNVIYHGWIDRGNLKGKELFEKLMRDCAFHICLSKVDLTPTAILEASAHGMPTLAFKVGGIPEMIENNKSGWLIAPTSDVKLIGKTITGILDNSEVWAEFGKEARVLTENRWNWDSVAQTISKNMLQLREMDSGFCSE